MGVENSQHHHHEVLILLLLHLLPEEEEIQNKTKQNEEKTRRRLEGGMPLASFPLRPTAGLENVVETQGCAHGNSETE